MNSAINKFVDLQIKYWCFEVLVRPGKYLKNEIIVIINCNKIKIHIRKIRKSLQVIVMHVQVIIILVHIKSQMVKKIIDTRQVGSTLRWFEDQRASYTPATGPLSKIKAEKSLQTN